MVWAMILPSGLLSYQIMEGKQDTKKYINIIDKFALLIIKLEVKPGFIFQQDNAPCQDIFQQIQCNIIKLAGI